MKPLKTSLTTSYLLKVTKFLVKISQFEFLVMTGKNIFVYKLFLLLNISDVIFFFDVSRIQEVCHMIYIFWVIFR